MQPTVLQSYVQLYSMYNLFTGIFQVHSDIHGIYPAHEFFGNLVQEESGLRMSWTTYLYSTY